MSLRRSVFVRCKRALEDCFYLLVALVGCPPAGVMTRMGRIITLANESGPVMDASNVALAGVHGVTGGALHLVVAG